MARKKIYFILQCQNSTVSDFNIRKRNAVALLYA